MSPLVIDSSIALSWCFEDEASPKTDRLFERVRDGTAFVPALWHLEVANVLLQAEKRGRIGRSEVAVRLTLISDLPVFVDSETTMRAWRDTVDLARRNRLTTYDAAYLELSLRRGLPLATKDRKLFSAARQMGVEALP